MPRMITPTLVLIAVLTLDLGVALGQNDASKAYRCTAKAVTIRDDGTFEKDPIAEARRKYYDGIVINPLTGAVTTRTMVVGKIGEPFEKLVQTTMC